jgi:hypothetical protein
MTPAPKKNANALVHGAHSEEGLRRVSTREKRAFLKSRGVRVSDLDKITVARLDHFVRQQAKLILLDAYLEEHGLLDEAGEPRPAAKYYPTVHNSAQRALDRLEASLEALEHKREQQRPSLAEYLAALDVEPVDEDDDDE